MKYLWIIIVMLSFLYTEDTINYAEELNEPSIERTNWFFYLYQKIDVNTYSRTIPFYSYARNSEQAYDKFFLWPLLIGYETRKNLHTEELPFAKQFRWYSIPVMTLSGHSVTPYTETNTLVSFSLLSFYQSRYTSEKYIATSWFSLPILSYYNRELLQEEDLEIDHLAFGGLFFLFQETLFKDHKKIYQANDWSIDPAYVLLGKDSFRFLRYQNWGRDSKFSLFSFMNFSLFEIANTFGEYPGSKYDYITEFDTDIKHGLKELYNTKKSPTTRFGFLSPFIQVTSNPNGQFSWQFLPFFYYESKNNEYEFSILPLALTFGSKGFDFSLRPKFFPIVYYDKLYNSWDILWPLFRFTNNPEYPKISLKMRFVFEYSWQQDSMKNVTKNFSLFEDFLFSYSENIKQKVVEVLPFGILFSYLKNDNGYQWRVLGFGYSENSNNRYLQLLFFNLSVGRK